MRKIIATSISAAVLVVGSALGITLESIPTDSAWPNGKQVINRNATNVEYYLNHHVTNDTAELIAATGSLNTAVGALNTATGTLNTAVGVLNTATGTLNTAVGKLNTATGVLNTAVGTLNTATGTLNTAVAALQTATNVMNTTLSVGIATNFTYLRGDGTTGTLYFTSGVVTNSL